MPNYGPAVAERPAPGSAVSRAAERDTPLSDESMLYKAIEDIEADGWMFLFSLSMLPSGMLNCVCQSFGGVSVLCAPSELSEMVSWERRTWFEIIVVIVPYLAVALIHGSLLPLRGVVR
jgi:Mn2+/Fe2+ NRAMP family transporter